jgi:hypothetical protein
MLAAEHDRHAAPGSGTQKFPQPSVVLEALGKLAAGVVAILQDDKDAQVLDDALH